MAENSTETVINDTVVEKEPLKKNETLPFPDEDFREAEKDAENIPDNELSEEARRQEEMLQKAIDLARSYGAGEKVADNVRDIIGILQRNSENIEKIYHPANDNLTPEYKERYKNDLEEELKHDAKTRYVVCRCSNNIFQRAFSALKMGKEIIWNKIASDFDKRKMDAIARTSHRYGIIKMKAEHRREEYELKMRPTLEKRLAKENAWRAAHNEELIPADKIYLLYRDSERMTIRAYTAQAEACDHLIEENGFLLEKKEMRARHARLDREAYIDTHRKIAANEIVLGKHREAKIIDISENREQKREAFPEKNRAIIDKAKTREIKDAPDREGLDEKLENLLKYAWDHEKNRETLKRFYVTGRKTGERFLPERYKVPVISMSVLIDKTLPLPEKRDRTEDISRACPGLSDATRTLTESAIYDITGFIKEADKLIEAAQTREEQRKMEDRKTGIIINAMKACPENAFKFFTSEIISTAETRPQKWHEMDTFIKALTNDPEHSPLQSIPRPFIDATELRMREIEEKLEEFRKMKEAGEEKEEEKEPVKKEDKEERLPFPEEESKEKTETEEKLPFPEEEIEVIEKDPISMEDVKKLVGALNDISKSSVQEKSPEKQEDNEKKAPSNVIQNESKENEEVKIKEDNYETPQQVIARRTIDVLLPHLKDEPVSFSLGKGTRQDSYRMQNENGEIKAEKYDLEKNEFVPLSRREMIVSFGSHCKEFQMYAKDIMRQDLNEPGKDRPEKETGQDREAEKEEGELEITG